MTREERQRFWSQIARDETQPTIARLRASELLGKSQADFVEVRVAPVVVDTQASEEELIDQVARIFDRIQQWMTATATQKAGQLLLPAPQQPSRRAGK
jgi:hypothetical protein